MDTHTVPTPAPDEADAARVAQVLAAIRELHSPRRTDRDEPGDGRGPAYCRECKGGGYFGDPYAAWPCPTALLLEDDDE